MQLANTMQGEWSLIERTSGRVVVERLELAVGYWSRLRGLQFRKRLPDGQGLLLAPGSSIHTCFVRFPIDVFFLDATGQVIGWRANVKPWRVALAPRKTRAVLELPAGAASLDVGEVLSVHTPHPDARVPKPLRFLAASQPPQGDPGS